MRKICKLVLAICVMLIFAVINIRASYDIYNLDELELKTSIPNDYFVITRDISPDSKILSNLGLKKSDIIEQFEIMGIYLNAFTDTYNEEIVVTMFENNDLSYFILLSDTELDVFASAMINQLQELGVDVKNYDIYHHTQTKFIKCSFFDKQNNVYGVQYSTLYDGKAINFTMRSYEGSLSSEQEAIIKTIVDEIEFYKDPPTLEQGEDTASFVYTDKDTDVTFTVPDNWKQEEFTKDREFIDSKFVSTKDSSGVIIYGSTDMWEEMSEYDKVGYCRSDLNNSAFTKSDIAEMAGTTEDEITTVTYNGIEYFKTEINTSTNIYNLDINVTITQLIFVNNGWMYTFQFSGTNTHKLYPEFETLLKSVQYPNISNNVSNFSNDNLGIITILVLLVIFLIIVIIVAIFRKKHNLITKYKQDEPKDNVANDEIFPAQVSQNTVSQDNNQIRFCRKCGQPLVDSSKFCSKCGTLVVKGN